MVIGSYSYCNHRAGGACPFAQAMAGPIFETFQDFSSGHMLVQAGICVLVACKLVPAIPD